MIKKLYLAIVLSALTTAAYGANNASDNAGNYGGVWANPAQGTGWGGDWVFQDSATSGHFIGDSTTNGSAPSGGINSLGDGAWGLFANSGTTSGAIRPFSGDLSIGDTFSMQIDQGFQDGGSTVGIGLQNSSGQNLFELYYIGGDSVNSWKINSAAGQQNLSPNVGFSTDGFNVTFTLQASNMFTGTFSDMHGNSTAFSGTLTSQTGGEGLSQVRLFNSNAGNGDTNNVFFNNMAISAVPEPSTLSLLAGPAILGAWFFVRRRRVS
ncbi:MAG: hypothetical protein QOH39_3114 [Verrucomicrobiota bacterium]|jgi:hypothetical protein